MNKTVKRLIIAGAAVIAAAGAAFAAVKIIRNANTKPVNVYNVRDFAMTDYWGDTSETYGMVTTDKIQKVYASDTQTITQVYVEEGDTVKKGDLLLSYDTTLSDIDLEKAEINLNKLELNISNAEKELTAIKALVPHSSKIVTPDHDEIVYVPQDTPLLVSGRGTSTDPVYCLYGDGDEIDDELIRKIFDKAGIDIGEPETEKEPETETEKETEQESEPESGSSSEEDGEKEGDEEEDDSPSETEDEPASAAEDPQSETEDRFISHSVYAAFVTRQNDALNAPIIRAWGLRIETTKTGYSFRYYDPILSAQILAADEVPDPYYVDTGSDYTSSEIAQMRSDKEKEIADLNNQLQMARVEYERLKAEVNDGRVYSTLDGVVKAVREPDEAQISNEAVVEVSAGGGYYINVALSELELDSMQIGQTVTVNSWENGVVCEGTVKEILDYPTTEASSWSDGNTNVSYYPFVVFVDEDANLRDGSYVNVTYEKAETNSGSMYIEQMFVINESGRNYVYVEDGEGLLEKRNVRTGRSLWGSYIEIISGLSIEDHIAFPYGRDVKNGAKTNEADSSEFYSSMRY